MIGERRIVEPEIRLQLAPLSAGLALVSIVGVVCVGLEVELVEQLDNVSRYMTYGEIALDFGVTLLFVSAAAVIWWACALLVEKIAGVIPWTKQHRERIFWLLGLGPPLSYAIFNCCDAVRLRVLPNWHPQRFAWFWVSFGVLVVLIWGLSRRRLSALQRFSRARFAPLGWLHIAAGIVAFLVLWAHGVHLFRDYVHPRTRAVASGSPDIYLITFDALGADEASVYGYSRPTTPALERFAQRSFTFDYFIANSNLTTPATTSIETGKLPWSHRVYQLGGFVRKPVEDKDLATSLRELGYYTAMISSNYWASPMQHRTLGGYDAAEFASSADASGVWLRYVSFVGLNTADTTSTFLRRLATVRVWIDALISGDRYPYPAEEAFQRARALIERHDIAAPRFLWTHIYPPHDPYLPPPEYRNRFLNTSKLTSGYDFLGFGNKTLPPGVSRTELRARYDETILYADHAVGDFLDWLENTGRLDQSIVIISSDHGESFDHNWLGHRGPYLYNHLIRVPLLIHLPGQQKGIRLSQPAQQADLLPTLLDLVGGPPPVRTDGRSLKPLFEGGSLADTPIFAMNLEPDRIFNPVSKGTVAIIDGEFKYINNLTSHQEEIYRYRSDKDEEHNLVATEPAVAEAMRATLLKKVAEVNQQYSAHQ